MNTQNQEKNTWTILQINSFIDNVENKNCLDYQLQQLDDINVCRGIITQLLIKNDQLRKELNHHAV